MSVYRPRDAQGRPKSPYWHYDFVVTLPDGKRARFSGSTGLAKKADAIAFEEERRRQEILLTGPAGLTVNEACWKYWDEVGKHQKSARNKATHLENLRRLLGSDTRLVDLKPQTIGDAVRTRAAEPITRRVRDKETGEWKVKQIGLPSGPTVNRTFTKPLHALLVRAEAHWGVPIRPSAFPWKDWLYPEHENPGRELTEEEEPRLWANVRADYYPLIWFLGNTGVRVGGALSMRKSKTDLARRRTQVLRKTKKLGEHWATIKLTDAQIAVLATEMAKSPGDQIWTYAVQRGKDKGKRVPVTYAALRSATDTMFRRAGLTGFRRHDLRHDFGSKLHRVTKSLKIVQEQLHHSSIGVTAKFYAHVQPDELVAGAEAVEASRNYTGIDKAKPKQAEKKGA